MAGRPKNSDTIPAPDADEKDRLEMDRLAKCESEQAVLKNLVDKYNVEAQRFSAVCQQLQDCFNRLKLLNDVPRCWNRTGKINPIVTLYSDKLECERVPQTEQFHFQGA